MTHCPACQARLDTPLGCSACGVLLSSDRAHSPFEVFGLEPGYRVDAAELKRRLLRFSRLVHPDYFGAKGPELHALAERNTAELNAAFEILSDDAGRADHLVRDLGGPSEQEERSMPQAFLMEVLEWNEALEAVRGSAPASRERAALAELAVTLAERRDATLQALARQLDPLPPRASPALAAARKELNALRYLDRALSEIEKLRLAQAASRGH